MIIVGGLFAFMYMAAVCSVYLLWSRKEYRKNDLNKGG